MLTIMDTDIVSSLRKPRRFPHLVAWFATLPATDIAISAPSVVEIARGIRLRAASDPAEAARLSEWLAALLGTHQCLPLDAAAAALLGNMAAEPALRNLLMTHPGAKRPQLGADLAIAAIAISREAAVATSNARDFRLIRQTFPALHLVIPPPISPA